MFKKIWLATWVMASAATLVGCGGGGGDGGGPTSSVTDFPLRAGYIARVTMGAHDDYLVSGSCSGTATMTDSGATPAVFETVIGYAASSSVTVDLSNCAPAHSSTSSTTYYDANFVPLGTVVAGGEYSAFAATSTVVLPATVRVGDSGTLATLDTFTDATKTTPTGQQTLSYVIESGSADYAVANLVSRGYNNAHQLLFAQQSRYRMTADGSLTVMSIDVQYSTAGSAHLVYTRALLMI